MIKRKHIEGMGYIAVLLLALLLPKLLHTPRYIVVLCGLVCLIVGLVNWRWSMYGILAYIPFAGIPIMAMYPSKAPLLFKDVFFVIPAYLGFLRSFLLRHKRTSSEGIKGILLWLTCSFAGLVLIQMFNPYLGSNSMFRLIGAKVWLFYIPLYFLAYHLINSEKELIKATKIMLCISVIPFSVGLIQAALVYSGHDHTVYQFYGSLAGPVTQGYVQFNISGGGYLRRLPGTFQYVTQYYNYAFSMLPLAAVMIYTIKRGHWALIAILVTAAGLLTGMRKAFVFLPSFWLLFTFLLRNFSLAVRLIVVMGLAVLLTSNITGTMIQGVYEHVFGLIVRHFHTTVSVGFVEALNRAPFGLGTGVSTGPARHALSSRAVPRWGAHFSENSYAKTVYELGIPGLLILIALFLTILRIGYVNYRLLRGTSLEAHATALLVFLILVVIDLVKFPALDYDPINVYFWMFAGIAAKLPTLERISLA